MTYARELAGRFGRLGSAFSLRSTPATPRQAWGKSRSSHIALCTMPTAALHFALSACARPFILHYRLANPIMRAGATNPLRLGLRL